MAYQTMTHFMTHSMTFFTKTVMAVSAATLLSMPVMAQNKALLFKEQGELAKAKTEIDNNVNDPKLATKAKTWVSRAQIYEALANDPKGSALDSNAASVAYDSYKKALEVEPNGKMTKEINEAMSGSMLYSAMMNQGVRQYQAKKYEDAYSSMLSALVINPKDTAAPMYAGVSVQQAMSAKGEGVNRADYTTRIKQQFEKYADNGGRDATVWASLAQTYYSDKEVDKALATLDRALKQFPNNRDLSTTRVSILQTSGRMDEAIVGMKELYEKNPGDAQSAVNLGIMYDNKYGKLADEAKKANEEVKQGGKLTKKRADEKAFLDAYMSEIVRLTASIKKQPKSADLKRQLADVQVKVGEQKTKLAELDQQIKAETAKSVDVSALEAKAVGLTKQSSEARMMARDYYQRAMAVDTNNFEANFNTGVGIFNDAVEMKREIDNMSMSDYTKNGKEVEGRVCGKFKQALPFFEKAEQVHEAIPTDYKGLVDAELKGPNGEPVIIGPRGGKYYINKNGNKTYVQFVDPVLGSTLEQLRGILKQFEEKKVVCVEPGK